jgi:NitT/TauT family transport system ATP-binding protein
LNAEPARGTAPLIRLRDVRKVYRTGGSEFVAVSAVTFDIFEGDLIALVGPSGCGKTTVLKILAGLHGTDGGAVPRAGSAFKRATGRGSTARSCHH